MIAISDDLTLEVLSDLVGEASGHDNNRADITFRRHVRTIDLVPHSVFVTVSVEICGGNATVSAGGVDHRRALLALLQNIEMHHREILRWHQQRVERAREILDKHGIYYVKGSLT